MIINHNVAALVTNNSLAKAGTRADKASKRLSTGLKINSAADNAAGLAIANKMKAQVSGLELANRNCNDAVSLIQTAEGGLAEITNMLQRVRELAVQGATDAVTDSDREKIQTEVNQLVDEIEETSKKIQFNNKTLFDADAEEFVFQIGANMENKVGFQMESITSETLNVKIFKDDEMYKSITGCEDAIDICDDALSIVSSFRAKLGSFQNRLDYTSASLDTSTINAQSSLSRIEDTDMAAEMTEYTTYNVITQAAISVLAQANQRPNQLLSLLQ